MAKKLVKWKPDRNMRRRRPKLRKEDQVLDLQKMNAIKWRPVIRDKTKWKRVTEEVRRSTKL